MAPDDHSVEETAARHARRSVRRALEAAERPAVRRELRETLQLLYAVEHDETDDVD